MYESQTFEAILQRMLDRVPSNVDKREGSIIYNALAPVAAELAQGYIELDRIDDESSLDTATGDRLEELCSQYGTFRKEASKAQRKGEFDVAVPIGSRFRLEDTTYVVLSNISGYEYILECEQAGEIGNIYTGALSPISHIEGLTTANLTEILVPGAEAETDEQLRERHRQNIINPPQDGNHAQYLKWATDYEDIGAAKVFPLWNGGNTVKVSITNRLYLPAEAALVEQFQNYIDPGITGLGNGVAPIGAKVTVTGGTRKDIDITADVVLAEGYTETEGAAEAVTEYLASITYVKNSVSYMRIGSILLDCPSIAELSNLNINGGVSDIPLGDEIPVLNSLNLSVVSA